MSVNVALLIMFTSINGYRQLVSCEMITDVRELANAALTGLTAETWYWRHNRVSLKLRPHRSDDQKEETESKKDNREGMRGTVSVRRYNVHAYAYDIVLNSAAAGHP